jgi:phosphinothricin acetyltransferase
MIRELEEKDCAGIAEIYNHYIRNSLISFETHEIDSDEILARVKKSRALGLYWLVYEDNDQIIGYTYASQWNARGAYKNTVEVSIYLSPDAVGNGRGSMLYSELFKRLHNESLHTAIGCIALPNPESVGLHEKFGMKKVAHFSEVGYKFGQWIDVGYWQVSLNA